MYGMQRRIMRSFSTSRRNDGDIKLIADESKSHCRRQSHCVALEAASLGINRNHYRNTSQRQHALSMLGEILGVLAAGK